MLIKCKIGLNLLNNNQKLINSFCNAVYMNLLYYTTKDTLKQSLCITGLCMSVKMEYLDISRTMTDQELRKYYNEQ